MELTNITKRERRELRRQKKKTEQLQRMRKRLFRRIFLWSFIVLGIGGAVFGIVKFASQTPSDSNSTIADINSIIESDWVKGNKNAEATLIEYSDFQCPACRSYFLILKQLNQELGDNVRFVYRHFPLSQTHRNAELAARAAEAGGKQNKFWEMHDMIFENQKEWSSRDNAREIFIQYADTLKLNIERFENDIDDRELKEKVESDYQSGIRAGVNSTPTFFLNGEKIKNPRNYEEFKTLIETSIL